MRPLDTLHFHPEGSSTADLLQARVSITRHQPPQQAQQEPQPQPQSQPQQQPWQEQRQEQPRHGEAAAGSRSLAGKPPAGTAGGCAASLPAGVAAGAAALAHTPPGTAACFDQLAAAGRTVRQAVPAPPAAAAPGVHCGRVCCNCGTTQTSVWGRNPADREQHMCSACRQYVVQHCGAMRPQTLWASRPQREEQQLLGKRKPSPAIEPPPLKEQRQQQQQPPSDGVPPKRLQLAPTPPPAQLAAQRATATAAAGAAAGQTASMSMPLLVSRSVNGLAGAPPPAAATAAAAAAAAAGRPAALLPADADWVQMYDRLDDLLSECGVDDEVAQVSIGGAPSDYPGLRNHPAWLCCNGRKLRAEAPPFPPFLPACLPA